MGQRANYIIRNKDHLAIYYNHWRANSIAADLYLGEARFLAFVRDCQPATALMEEAWIEGCVVVDVTAKEISFWSLEFPTDTSVVTYYLMQLSKKWPGWRVKLLANRMYDVERILRIDYISRQKLGELHCLSAERIIADKVEEWTTALVIIKGPTHLFVTMTGSITVEPIITHGPDVIPLLLDKPPCDLPREGAESTDECIVLDTLEKKIIVNKSLFGVWEQCGHLWPGYTFIMGDTGYLEVLQLAGIETAGKELPAAEIRGEVDRIVRIQEDFDPEILAQRVAKGYQNVQFNPDFFDKVQPKKNWLERLQLKIRKLLRRN